MRARGVISSIIGFFNKNLWGSHEFWNQRLQTGGGGQFLSFIKRNFCKAPCWGGYVDSH